MINIYSGSKYEPALNYDYQYCCSVVWEKIDRTTRTVWEERCNQKREAEPLLASKTVNLWPIPLLCFILVFSINSFSVPPVSPPVSSTVGFCEWSDVVLLFTVFYSCIHSLICIFAYNSN